MRCILNSFLGDLQADALIPINDLITCQVQRYADHLLEKGQSLASVKHSVAVVKMMLTEAMREGQVTSNAASGVRIYGGKINKRLKAKALTYDEGKRWMDAADVQMKAGLVLLADNGSRGSDPFTGDWEHVDLRAGEFTFWAEKPDVWHTVALLPPTLEFLREYKKFHCPKTSEGYIIPKYRVRGGENCDRQVRTSDFNRIEHYVAKDLITAGLRTPKQSIQGVKPTHAISLRSWRVTNITALRMARIPIPVIMARALHESERMNRIYQRLDAENVRKAVFDAANLPQHRKVDPKGGSMTLPDILKLIAYATEQLVKLRNQHSR
jgi:integrase